MAHSCPECGQVCHCGGDIDDILFEEGTPEEAACRHCECPKCQQMREDCMCFPDAFDEAEEEPL